MDDYRDIINRALDRESRSYKRSGWAWLVFGLVMQTVLFMWHKTNLLEHSMYGSFIFFSAPLAWWPIIGGLVQLWRARSLRSSNELLRRALTTTPQLIATVEKGTYSPILPVIFDLIGSILASLGRSDAVSSHYHTSGDDTSNSSSACVFVRLTNGKKYRLSAYEHHEQLIAAIYAHAPHAETSGNSQTKGKREQKIPEPAWRVQTRYALLCFGGLLLAIVSIMVFAQFMNARERTKYTKHGVRATAVVSELRSFKDDEKDESSKTHYIVEAKFNTREGKPVSSKAGLVEKPDYEKLKVGDTVEVYYLPESPNYFALSETAERYRDGYAPHPVFIAIGLTALLMLVTGIVMSIKRLRRLAGAPVNAMLAFVVLSVLLTAQA